MVSDDKLVEHNWLYRLWKYDKGIIFLCLLTITGHFYMGGLEVDRWVNETKSFCVGFDKYQNLTNTRLNAGTFFYENPNIDLDYLELNNNFDDWFNNTNS